MNTTFIDIDIYSDFVYLQTQIQQQESANSFVIYVFIRVCVCAHLFIATVHG